MNHHPGIKSISTKDLLKIIASTDVDQSAAWSEEFVEEITKCITLLIMDLDKLRYVIDDPKLTLTSLGAMDSADKGISRLQAYFASFRSKYAYLTRVKSLDDVPSTISGEIQEHDPDSFA